MINVIDLKFQGVAGAIAAFLIETQTGIALVETGPYSTFNTLKNAIEAKGYHIEDIEHVFLTHVHLDHAGAAWAFAEAGANIYVHPLGAKHLIDPSRLYDSAKRIYKDKMDSLWGDMRPIPKNQVISVGHKERIKVGVGARLVALHTPGHAKHHIAWQYKNAILTGDVAGVKTGNMVVPPCPPPDIDLDAWSESIKLLRKTRPDALYLTHFGAIDTNIKGHLIELRARLYNWANWIKPFVDMDISFDELTQRFQAYVREQYLAAGLTEDDIKIYEAANPSWMSVAGLVRYWKKQEV